MTESQILTVQKSWPVLSVRMAEIGTSFYNRLFERAPHLQVLFHESAEIQGRKFMNLLAMVITKLNTEDRADEHVSALGVRHVGYGVQPEYFPLFGEVLMETLADTMGQQWTQETAEAWQAAFQFMSRAMIQAGNQVS